MENTKEQVWLSDKIGESYTEWKDGDAIFISAPTGAGKTTFIFEKLIPFAIKEKRHILYLVNRRILMRQLEDKLNEIRRENLGKWSVENDNLIEISTYQELEKTMENNGDIPSKLSEYNYIVMDEAHYFMSDASFNTSTELSFHELISVKKSWARCLLGSNNGYIRIFMSATIENIYKYYCEIKDSLYAYKSVPFQNIIPIKIPLETQYKKLNVHLFKGYEDIADVIGEAGNEKWLVFVDDRKKGMKLNSDLEEKQIKSIFIDAYYEKEPEALDEVENIIEKKQSSAQVCILTYVLDCGASIEENRNNIVIFADNEIEFLQCLGRRRTMNYEDMHLYIPVRKRRVFSERLTKMNNVVDSIQKYIEKTIKIYDDEKDVKERKKQLDEKECKPWKLKLDGMNLLKLVLANKKTYDAARKTCYVGSEDVELHEVPYAYMNQFSTERFMNLRDVYTLLCQAIEFYNLKAPSAYQFSTEQLQSLRQIFTSLDHDSKKRKSKVPYVCMNQLSIEQLKYLRQIYSNLDREMENDEWAFVKMQLSWLRREDDFEEIKAEFCTDKSELLRQEIESKLHAFPEDGMDSTDRIEWYNDIRKPLRDLLQIKMQSEKIENAERLMNRLGKAASKDSSQIISDANFNRLMEILQLPYKMEKKKGNMFIRSV